MRVHGSDRDVLTDIGALRLQAWAPIVGQDTASSRFSIDQHDASAWHCIVFTRGVMVAAGRLTVHRDLDNLPESTSFGPYLAQMHVPLGFASRLVVHPGHQRRGFAEQIIADRLGLAIDHGLTEVWGETRRHQVHGLTRHGYEPLGPSADHSVPGEWVVLRAQLTTNAAELARAASPPARPFLRP